METARRFLRFLIIDANRPLTLEELERRIADKDRKHG